VTGPNTVLGKGAPENLQAGDRLWLHPEIPASQSVHCSLIAAFVRGSTNPPPEQWFYVDHSRFFSTSGVRSFFSALYIACRCTGTAVL
jgi:hypothetical protein